MTEVIKTMYAKELELIADTPSAIRMKWTDYLARLKDRVWDRQSIAMMTLFMAFLSRRDSLG